MVELLVTIAIATILTTIAVPSFSGLIASQRAKTAASELFSSLLQARSDAIMLNANVTVSPLAGGWKLGWQILGPGAVVLESHGAVPGVAMVADNPTDHHIFLKAFTGVSDLHSSSIGITARTLL